MNTVSITPGQITSPVTHFLYIPDQNAVARSIMDCVAHYYGYSYRDMIARRRTQHLAYARQMAMTLVRAKTSLSLYEIADLFSRNDHGTVLHACAKIRDLRSTYQKTQQEFVNLEAILGSSTTIGRVVT